MSMEDIPQNQTPPTPEEQQQAQDAWALEQFNLLDRHSDNLQAAEETADRMYRKDELYEAVGLAALGEDVQVPDPQTFWEGVKASRIARKARAAKQDQDKHASKVRRKEAERDSKLGAFGSSVPGMAGESLSDFYMRQALEKAGVETDIPIHTTSRTVGVRGKKIERAASKRQINKAYKKGQVDYEMRGKLLAIKLANPRETENVAQRRSRRAVSRANRAVKGDNKRIERVVKQPVLSRWREMRRNRAWDRYDGSLDETYRIRQELEAAGYDTSDYNIGAPNTPPDPSPPPVPTQGPIAPAASGAPLYRRLHGLDPINPTDDDPLRQRLNALQADIAATDASRTTGDPTPEPVIPPTSLLGRVINRQEPYPEQIPGEQRVFSASELDEMINRIDQLTRERVSAIRATNTDPNDIDPGRVRYQIEHEEVRRMSGMDSGILRSGLADQSELISAMSAFEDSLHGQLAARRQEQATEAPSGALYVSNAGMADAKPLPPQAADRAVPASTSSRSSVPGAPPRADGHRGNLYDRLHGPLNQPTAQPSTLPPAPGRTGSSETRKTT